MEILGYRYLPFSLRRLLKARKLPVSLVLFLAAWFVYNLNCRPIASGDTAPTALLPFSIVLDGQLSLDRYADGLSRLYDGQVYFLEKRHGHTYSRYPVTIPVLLSPAYLPLRLVPEIRSWPMMRVIFVARVLEKLWASMIAAGAVAALFVLLRRLTETRYALVLALIFGFATNTWVTSSQALWQHGMGQLTIILSLGYVHRFLETARITTCALAGGFAALSVAVRPTNLLFFAVSLVVLLAVAGNRARVLASYAAPGVLVGTALAAYNLLVLGSLAGGYANETFSKAFLHGLAGLTISPSHGLLVYTPVLIFVLPGMWLALRATAPYRALGMISAGFFVSLLVLYANYKFWFGGTCYGPRYLTEALPGLILLLVPVLPILRRSRALSASFVVATAFSVMVQFVGAFCYASSRGPERPLWDWKNNSVVISARAGVYTEGYGFLLDCLRARRPDFRYRGRRVE